VDALRAAALTAALAVLNAASSDDLRGTLQATAGSYYRQAAAVAGVAGADTTMDYYDRLVDDAALLGERPPSPYPPELWENTVRAASQLDLSLAMQLLQRTYQPMADIRGLGETLVRSSKDGTMQPVAVYVPTSYSAQKPVALALFLHGNQQAESHLLAPQYLRDLAERSGTIVVAPYGRGAYDFRGVESDVDDAYRAAGQAFAIDPRRRYLAGYSMGGFSVFRLAPLHPAEWTAIMSIAGSLLQSRSGRLLSTMPENVRYYIVTGSQDDNVPTVWPTATAIFLRDTGRPVSFYSQRDGTHALFTLQPAIAQAWNDMERGVVRAPSGLTGAPDLPEAAP
jgi:poly(3-hydroxybutyrate) depolymerase